MTAIKGLLLDFGEVINVSPERTANSGHRARLAARVNKSPEELWPYLFSGPAARLWMTGKIDWGAFWTAVLLPLGISDPEDIEAFAGQALLDTETVSPEMAVLIGELMGRYRLGVVSNASWNDEQLSEILYRGGLLPPGAFDTVVTSTSVGFIKPEAGIFEEALRRLDLSPAETLFVDDMQKNIDGAARLGIRGYRFETPQGLRDHLVALELLPGQ